MSQKRMIGINQKWWVLRHLDPKAIDLRLRQLNEQRAAHGDEAFLYVIPHQHAKEATFRKGGNEAYNKKVQENNDLRSTLHYYLFIKATEAEILGLVSSEWNRSTRLRLHLCRSKCGELLWASPKDMDQLIKLLMENRQLFNLVPAPLDYRVDDRVMLKAKAFQGYEFYVKKVRLHGEGVSLQLELPIFNGRFVIQTDHIEVSKQHLPMKLKELLSEDYVKNMERSLIDILRRRFKRQKDTKEDTPDGDSDSMNDFHFLSYLELDGTPRQRHIRTLQLLSAALRNDRRSVEYFAPAILQHLANPLCPANDEEALMVAVLYVATHNVDYRTAAKQYEQTHGVSSEPLSQLMPIIKNIHFRNNNNKSLSKKIESKVTRQSQQTLQLIRDCDFSSLSPKAVCAMMDILALPHFDTEEGHLLQQKLKNAVGESLSTMTEEQESQVSHATFEQSRNMLLRSAHPSADSMLSYYRLLCRHYPNRHTLDGADYYNEFMKRLLDIYSKTQPFTTSWWQLKFILEHYTAAR